MLVLAHGGAHGTTAGIAHSLFSHRVGQQKFRWPAAAVSCQFKHGFKHIGDSAGIPVGPFHGGQANTVGLPFMGSAKTQLAVHGQGLGGNYSSCSCITAGSGRQYHAGQQAGQGQGRGFALGLSPPGKVALAEVGQFVGQYRGHLVLVFRKGKDTGMEAHHAARYREGIHRRVFNDHQFQPRILQFAVGGQVVEQLLQVDLHQRIVVGFHPAAKDLQPDTAQLILLLFGDNAGGGIAQYR